MNLQRSLEDELRQIREMAPPYSEFMDRPKLRQWKAHTRRMRWEKRLARAPYYRLALVFLFVAALTVLLTTVLVSIWLGR